MSDPPSTNDNPYALSTGNDETAGHEQPIDDQNRPPAGIVTARPASSCPDTMTRVSLSAGTIQEPKPWGFWATTGWIVLSFIAMLAIGVACIAIAAALDPRYSMMDLANRLQEGNGFVDSLGTLFQSLIILPILFLAIRLRRFSVVNYLALKLSGRRSILGWSLAGVVLYACEDLVTYLCGYDIVHESMITAYQTAGFLPLLLVVVIVIGPVTEELVCRGFMFKGIASSPLGTPGAIAITAAFWAVLHVQYEWFGIGVIVASGIFLGIARAKTGSTIIPLMLHMLVNILATMELGIVVSRTG